MNIHDIYIYIYTCVCVCVCVYACMYICGIGFHRSFHLLVIFPTDTTADLCLMILINISRFCYERNFESFVQYFVSGACSLFCTYEKIRNRDTN